MVRAAEAECGGDLAALLVLQKVLEAQVWEARRGLDGKAFLGALPV